MVDCKTRDGTFLMLEKCLNLGWIYLGGKLGVDRKSYTKLQHGDNMVVELKCSSSESLTANGPSDPAYL